MAQENRHLTTEQLSAYLDEQVSATEQSKLEVHLHACERCQQELVDLRQTVTLLHAMPQPRLPQSFVLPIDTSFFTEVSTVDDTSDAAVPVPLASVSARQVAAQNVSLTTRRSRWPIYVRSALRSVSAIAAVLGLVLLISGLLASVSYGTSASEGSYNVSTASQPMPTQTPQADQAYGAQASATSTESTPGAASAENKGKQQSIQSVPTATANSASPRLKTSDRNALDGPRSSTQPTILFFDLSVPQARSGFGFLLLLLGCMGFIVFKRRKRLAHQE